MDRIQSRVRKTRGHGPEARRAGWAKGKRGGTALLLIGCLAVARTAWPCSSLVLLKGKSVFFGTNYDNLFAPGQIFLNRRNVLKAGWQTGTTGRAANWTSRFGSVTISCAGYQLAWGGMNEAGLVFSTMLLPGTRVPPPDERPPLAGAFWWQYILDTCSTVEDVREAMKSFRITDTPDHYLVCDRNGGCAVVECLEGRLVIRAGGDLPVRALTNTPYQQCFEHLMNGTPGPADSNHSLNRFTRLTKGLTQLEAGSATGALDGVFGLLAGVAAGSLTRWSFVCDTNERIFYFKTYGNRKTRFVDLKKVDFSCRQPTMMIDAHADLEGDITRSFHAYNHEEALAHMVRAMKYFRPGIAAEMVRDTLNFLGGFSCQPERK
jgi:penicillin V acylase-like amidase (Ntn superfamily)